MKIYKFYDTSSLLAKGSALFDNEDSVIVISSISLKELEDNFNSLIQKAFKGELF